MKFIWTLKSYGDILIMRVILLDICYRNTACPSGIDGAGGSSWQVLQGPVAETERSLEVILSNKRQAGFGAGI